MARLELSQRRYHPSVLHIVESRPWCLSFSGYSKQLMTFDFVFSSRRLEEAAPAAARCCPGMHEDCALLLLILGPNSIDSISLTCSIVHEHSSGPFSEPTLQFLSPFQHHKLLVHRLQLHPLDASNLY